MISLEHLSGFGEALKDLRWRARMKQVEVCRATRMTAPQVSRYENGHEMPTVESLVKYLSAVGADFRDLQRALEAAAAGDQPSEEPQPRVEENRLQQSPALRQVVGGLMELNLEGMERLEHRMRSLEELMETYTALGGKVKKVPPSPAALERMRKRREAGEKKSEEA